MHVGKVAGVSFTLSADDQNFLKDGLGMMLNQKIQAAVEAVAAKGVIIRFVNPVDAFMGHAICSSDPWINGLLAFYNGTVECSP